MRNIQNHLILLGPVLALLIGCKEEAAKPQTANADSAAPAVSMPPSDPELQPISGGAAAMPPAIQSAGQGTSGAFVVQVGILPSQSSAKRLVDKLQGQGITAYVAEVEDPGDLEGTYYRVRIGFFGSIDAARGWATSTLQSLGYAWWIDLKRNDSVGNPGSGSSEVTSTSNAPATAPSTPATSDWGSAPSTPAPSTPAASAPAADAGWGESAAPAAPATPTPPAVTPPAAPSVPATPAAPSAPASAASAADGWGVPTAPAAPSAPAVPAAPSAPSTPAADDDWN